MKRVRNKAVRTVYRNDYVTCCELVNVTYRLPLDQVCVFCVRVWNYYEQTYCRKQLRVVRRRLVSMRWLPAGWKKYANSHQQFPLPKHRGCELPREIDDIFKRYQSRMCFSALKILTFMTQIDHIIENLAEE